MHDSRPPRDRQSRSLRAHLRWRTIDPLRPAVRDFLRLFCGDAHLAEDLSQETVVRAWLSGAPVETFDRPDAWLILVARNVARDHLRHEFARPCGHLDQGDVLRLVGREVPPGEEAEDVLLEVAGEEHDRGRLSLVLRRVWGELPLRDRQVLGARYFDEQSSSEIAGRHGAQPATTKVWLYRARRRLRGRIERYLVGERSEGLRVEGDPYAMACAEPGAEAQLR